MTKPDREAWGHLHGCELPPAASYTDHVDECTDGIRTGQVNVATALEDAQEILRRAIKEVPTIPPEALGDFYLVVRMLETLRDRALTAPIVDLKTLAELGVHIKV